MRKFRLLVLSCLCLGLIGLWSCSDDEPDNEIAKLGENVVRYNTTDYPVDLGFLDDFEDAGGHYNIDFSVTDGVYIPVQLYIGDYPITYWTARDATIEVYAELYAPLENSDLQPIFRTGTFTFSAATADDVTSDAAFDDQYVFISAYVAIDTNGDRDLPEEEEIVVTGGTIKVSGEYPNFVLTYDLELANGSQLIGSYSREYLVDN